MAGELLMSISKDERERAVFRSRRMYQTDLMSNLATAEDRGRREGRQEGLRDGRIEGLRDGRIEGLRDGRIEGLRDGRIEGNHDARVEIAKKMLRRNRPLEEIIEDSGLTREEVEALRT